MRIRKPAVNLLDGDPLWYKDAIVYEVHARAFRDSNGDGIGDLRGLIEKLDYVQDLGVTALWLLPFYPSPLRDDGYDIADYTDVNPIYGTLADFKMLLREAHLRGLRVITELVINHTSDRHPWFQRARYAAPGSNWRDFYVWSDSTDKYRDARIIFQDFEASNWTWDPVAHAHYWHRFYSHQPDLNFDNPAVHQAVIEVLDFWLNLGIDGLRLDAVPYLYERDGTTCENLPETHDFLKKLRRHVDEHHRNRLLLAEANQWPEDSVTYFGAGDECHMAFHFPLMPRLFMSIRMEDRFPIIDILQQTPVIPDNSQWALFLRNHDELTLEMVTAEDRDYMYRVYAQDTHARVNLGIRRRLAPLLENHRGKIELMNGLLFSLPGTPVLYYGDEIGMGDNIYLGDRNGVRTPMQWTPERNAGFSSANPQRLYLPAIIDPEYHYQTVNVEAQQNNPHSLLWWMKRMIALRKRSQAFGRGTLEFIYPENHRVLAFLRRYRDEKILIVANLSRFMQCAELDLAAFKGMTPVEMLGRTPLPSIGDRPYVLTLGPYAIYWLHLEPAPTAQIGPGTTEAQLPTLEVAGDWLGVFLDPGRDSLERVLLPYLGRQRWFAGKGGRAKSARIVENLTITHHAAPAAIALVQVEYTEGEARTFVLPIAFKKDEPPGSPDQSGNLTAAAPICRLQVRAEGSANIAGFLYDPVGDKGFATALLNAFIRQRPFRGSAGELLAWTVPRFHRLRGFTDPRPEPALVKAEQSNTSVIYGDRLVLKLCRWIEEGVSLEIEVGRALAEKTTFTHAPPLIGALEYRPNQGASMTVATLSAYVPNEGDAWRYTLDALRRYFENVLTRQDKSKAPLVPNRRFLDLAGEELPAIASEMIGSYLEAARLMGRRTAELHLALSSIPDDPAFTPEPMTVLYQRSSYQTSRTWVYRVFTLLREQRHSLPEEAQESANRLLAREADLVHYLRAILNRRITVDLIRCHSDYRLENLLFTGRDFAVIDFEGEILRPLSNRRHKRAALTDVAGLVYSFYRAVRTIFRGGHLRPEDKPALEPWARFWYVWVSVAFLKAYGEGAGHAAFLPSSRDEMQSLLDFNLLGRGIFDLHYQMLNHLDRTPISLQAMLLLLELRDRREADVTAVWTP
jgi:maltose alpha-D-glucosyltransferase/alpha-amylase